MSKTKKRERWMVEYLKDIRWVILIWIISVLIVSKWGNV